MLRLQNVSYSYIRTLVLQGVSLVLPPRRVLYIVGPSGCGKTTLLNIAAGLLAPTSGAVENQFQQRAYVFQEPRLLPWRTTRQNIAFGLKARGVGRDRRHQIAEQLAAQLDLSDALDKYPDQLSGGMQQRAAIGRALAIEPDLLLLDEPFSALDVGLRHELQSLVLDLLTTRHLSALFVTHDLVEAVRMGDELLILSPAPGTVVHHWRQERAPAAREPAYLYETVSNLMRVPSVVQAFNLSAAMH